MEINLVKRNDIESCIKIVIMPADSKMMNSSRYLIIHARK